MNRRVWAGVVAGVLAALLVLGVAGAAYRVGEHHEVVTRTVGTGDVVRVVGNGWGYDHGGGGFFFFLFPLFGILLLFLLLRGRRWGGYRGGYWGGGGPVRCGPADWAAERDKHFDDEHRRAHERASSGPPETAEA